MFNKRYVYRLVCVLVILTLCAGMLSGCKNNQFEELERFVVGNKDEHEFDLLMDELFADMVTADSISLNYYLAFPENFDIERPYPTYGEVTTEESIRESEEERRELSDRLSGFRYSSLRPDQKIVYDILVRDIALYDEMSGGSYYIGYIRPTNGLQVQLPIILAEFNFYTVSDIEQYLLLLEDTLRYFDEIIVYERERVRRGYFLSESNIDSVIENCESFLEERENNLLISVFNDRIDQYEGLSAGQREEFKQRNRDLVLGNVLPAYDLLLDALHEFRGTPQNAKGLADLPNGKAYAQAYLSYRTGSDRTAEQVDRLLMEWMGRMLTDIMSLMSNNPDIMTMLNNDTLGQIDDDTHENYLLALHRAMTPDFPAIESTRYVVREVHELLQEHVSPAFYLTPALDYFDDNVIYVNPSSITDNISLFTTLAHEGYPGHMYQTVYFLQQSPHPIRTLLGPLGYSEGWATYTESLSYSYAGLDDDVAAILEIMRLYDLLLMSRIDLGVNALGWGLDRVSTYLEQLGIMDQDTVLRLYEAVTGNPLFYMPYALGYIELSTLRQDAERELRNDFDLLEFHRFILDFGPVHFSLISSQMQDWADAWRAELRDAA